MLVDEGRVHIATSFWRAHFREIFGKEPESPAGVKSSARLCCQHTHRIEGQVRDWAAPRRRSVCGDRREHDETSDPSRDQHTEIPCRAGWSAKAQRAPIQVQYHYRDDESYWCEVG